MRPEDLRALARSVVERAPGDAQVEVFAARTTDVTVEVGDGSVDALGFSESRGAGVRAVAGGRLGFCSTTDLSPAGLDRALRRALENARLAEPDGAYALPDPVGDVTAGPPGDVIEPVPVDRLVAAAVEFERLALAGGSEIVQAAPAMIGQEIAHMALVSSTGIDAAWERSDAYAVVSALARRGAESGTGVGFTYRRRFDELDLAGAAAEAGVRARRLLGARPAPTASLPVILDPLATARLLKVLAPAFSGRAVAERTSPFAERLGERVAAERLTLVDDGRVPGAPGTAPVDDEGVPTGRTVLIDAGRVAGFLHNGESARRFGEGAASTGNARRTGFRGLPGVQPTNLFFDGPREAVPRILASVDRAVYVQDFKGLHSGHNRVSGEFSVGFAGSLVRGGELAEPLCRMTLSFTLDGLLTSVAAIGDDRRFYPLASALGGATLLFGPVTVVGS